MLKNHIIKHAHRLHKLLLLGAVTVSLAGLSGCTRSRSHVTFPYELTDTNITSPTLNHVISDQFDIHTVHYHTSDAFSHGTIYFHVKQLGGWEKAKHYAPNAVYVYHYLGINAPQGTSSRVMYYHFDNADNRLTLSSTRGSNTLESITYKLTRTDIVPSSSYMLAKSSPYMLDDKYVFRPISLKRFGRSPARIPLYISRHNEITLKTGFGNGSIIGGTFHHVPKHQPAIQQPHHDTSLNQIK